MRILFITTYFEPDSGAAAVRLSRLAKLLAARGHHVTVLTTMPHYPVGQIREGYRGRFTITEERDGLKIVRAWLWATPSTRISRRFISQVSFMLTAFWRGLFISQPDVVFIEAQPVFTGFAAVLLSKLKRAPYMMNISDFWPEHLLSVGAVSETHPVYRLSLAWVNWMYNGAKKLVGVNPALTESVIKRIGREDDVKTIFNAVDLGRIRPGLNAAEFKAKHGLDTPDKLIVSFVGTFGTHIDINTMLDAAARLRNRDDVYFVFIGTGGQRDALAERIAQDDLAHTRWIGWIDHHEMPLAWAASDVTYWAVHNRELYRGALQAKIYEAIASGTPVVVATEGLTAQMAVDSGAGRAVPFGDAEGLAREIAALLDDPEQRARHSTAGRAYAEANFDPERIVTAYEDMIAATFAHK